MLFLSKERSERRYLPRTEIVLSQEWLLVEFNRDVVYRVSSILTSLALGIARSLTLLVSLLGALRMCCSKRKAYKDSPSKPIRRYVRSSGAVHETVIAFVERERGVGVSFQHHVG